MLAGDVGGTKVLLGLYEPATRRPRALAVQRFETATAPSIEDLIVPFLRTVPNRGLESVVLGVAGPVADGHARLTNHPWTLDAQALARRFGAPVRLINDLEATAYALDALDDNEVATLHAGHPNPVGPMAVLAAGTGLGAALLVRSGGTPIACPSEAGHADFAPRSAREDEIVQRLRREFGRASVEHVLSGQGLVRLHAVTHGDAACPAVADAAVGDRPAAITSSALESRCERCEEALRIFVSAYGSEAGNLALRTLPTGGLFIGGGIALAVQSALQGPGFLDAFHDKPPMGALLETIPVRLIRTPEAGLLGAAVVAQRGLR